MDILLYKALSAPSFGHFIKQTIGFAYSRCLNCVKHVLSNILFKITLLWKAFSLYILWVSGLEKSRKTIKESILVYLMMSSRLLKWIRPISLKGLNIVKRSSLWFNYNTIWWLIIVFTKRIFEHWVNFLIFQAAYFFMTTTEILFLPTKKKSNLYRISLNCWFTNLNKSSPF